MSHGRHVNPVAIINSSHSDDLLAAARALSGHPDATAARAERVDRGGIDVVLETPGGPTDARLDFAEPVPEGDSPDDLRAAFVDLTRRARAILAAGGHPGATQDSSRRPA